MNDMMNLAMRPMAAPTPVAPPQQGAAGSYAPAPPPTSGAPGGGGFDPNTGVATANAKAQANAGFGAPSYNQNPEFGGYQGGAADFANYAQSVGDSYAGQAAPQLGQLNTNGTADRNASLAAIQGAGAVPGQAMQQFGQNLAQAQTANTALGASAGGGGAAGAAARTGAAMQNAAAAGTGAQQGTMLNAQLKQQAAQQQYAGLQALGASDYGVAQQQAQLDQGQMSLAQQGELSGMNLGNNANLDQLGASANTYDANMAATLARQKASDAQRNAGIMGAVGLISGGASGAEGAINKGSS